MKTLLIAVIAIIGLSGCGKDNQHICRSTGLNPHKIDQTFTKRKSPTIYPSQQGCCSWHGGICGCEGGRVVCCDGTYSPSCRCYH